MPAKNPPLETRLAAIDLNLFVALEALLACQNVSRAAQRLGITQPAMSRSLARLRELFGRVPSVGVARR
ncbi:LysR family transcriptional regulator [Ensifer adhaerens]|uniref:LysR family transcriptional regulator n=1 Tax=Ensifer adhaerens TaxID=106592 RepID=UPI00384F890E